MLIENVLVRSQYLILSVKQLFNYFLSLTVNHHEINSLWGFFAIITIMSQLITGTMLSFSLIPDPMLIPIARDEEDCEDLTTDDFFFAHERGVDLLFIFAYIHLFRKFYLSLSEYEHESTWKSGAYTLIIMQVVVFFGLVLCSSHLSEITLTIAANIMHTFFLFHGKPYWWLFTDKQLNCDTMIRLAFAHYLAAFFMMYLAVMHSLDMHYDWKNESAWDGNDNEIAWFDEALSNELVSVIVILLAVFVVCYHLYPYPEALSYEIFMWGDVGFIPDIRFYGVSPHWYFRPLMAWLLVCPFHKLGIAGLLLYFVSLYFQPNMHGDSENLNFSRRITVVYGILLYYFSVFSSNIKAAAEYNFFYQTVFGFFIMCGIYTYSFLPYGRFYNRLGGNVGMLGAYVFFFFYLIFASFRKPLLLELCTIHNLENVKALA